MPTPFPRPAAPGTVPADRLAAVEELHALCRRWCEHVPQQLPYTDLTFAFGFATLGDPTRARRLLADAWTVMQHPVPPPAKPNKDYHPVPAAQVPRFAYHGFEYRIEQALAGQPLGRSLSVELLAHLDQIQRDIDPKSVNDPRKWTLYVITRLREQSRILAPDDRIDPYSDWTKHGGPLMAELDALVAVREPAAFADRIRHLYREPPDRKHREAARLRILHAALPLAPRVGEAFAAELLGLIPEALTAIRRTGRPEPPDIPLYQRELLERALDLAVRLNRPDSVQELVRQFCDLAERGPELARYRLINTAGWQCLRSLWVLGPRDDLDRFLIRLWIAIPDMRPSLGDLEAVAAYLQARLVLAAGWLTLGKGDDAAPVLEEARRVLLAPDAPRLQPKDYTELARAYVSALGQEPADAGLPRMAELFREVPREKITNTWTTAPYYSRLHLNLTEEAVAAVCRMLLEPPLR